MELPAKTFWMKASYFGVASIPVGWLIFALKYTDRAKWLSSRTMAALTVVPILTLAVVWTNDWHHLMWKEIWLDTSLSPAVDAVTHGPWFWVFATYSYSLLLWGTICLALAFGASSGVYRRQAGTLVVAALVPWIANSLFIVGLSPFKAVDPTPLAFATTGVVFYWGLSKLRLLDVLPIAHEAILRSIADGAIVLDTRQRVVELNPAAERIVGRSKSELLGQHYSEALPGQAALLELTTDMPESRGVVALGQGQAQRYYSLNVSPIVTRERVRGHLILLHDDTERIHAETESRQRVILETELSERSRAADEIQRRLEFEKTLSRVSSRFVGIADIQGAIVESLRDLGTVCRASRGYMFLLRGDGLAMDKRAEWCAPGVGPSDDNATEMARNIFHWWMSAPANGEAIRIDAAPTTPVKARLEKEMILSQGIRSVLAFPVVVTQSIAGFIGIDNSVEAADWSEEDVTVLRMTAEIVGSALERKKAADESAELNEQLNSLNSQLESKVEERTRQLENAVAVAKASDQAKSEFLASMSHELRTPLNAIIGFSQVLHEQYFGSLNEKQAEYISDIVGSGKHLLSLINDILDLSKVEAGKLELEVSEVKIAELLRSSMVMIKEKALAHMISLELEISADLEGLGIAADERRLKQVMFNLLSNAAKFTPDGGSITVAARKKGDVELEVSVTDTGIGMTVDEQKRLFEPFYQASGGIKDKTPGTGLGLAITKRIVEKHGGRIWMHSDGPSKGSQFAFTLPVRDIPPGDESVIVKSLRDVRD
jgi:PAS domain S-box-containing protein